MMMMNPVEAEPILAELNEVSASYNGDPALAVLQFHKATDSTVGQGQEVRDAELRARLIFEEAIEFANAVGLIPTVNEAGEITFTPNGQEPNLVEAVDALADELYVTYGAGAAFGVYLPQVFAEVHRSNMTKIGGETRDDGKILKPDTFEEPRVAEVLDAMRRAEDSLRAEIARQEALMERIQAGDMSAMAELLGISEDTIIPVEETGEVVTIADEEKPAA